MFAATAFNWSDLINSPSAVPIIVGGLAVIGGLGLAALRAVLRHKERIAKIENGIDPDRPDLKTTQPWKS